MSSNPHTLKIYECGSTSARMRPSLDHMGAESWLKQPGARAKAGAEAQEGRTERCITCCQIGRTPKAAYIEFMA